MGGRQHDQSSAGLQAIRRASHLTAIVLNVLQHVDIENRIESYTERQILTWDRMLVLFSRLIDPIFAGRVGKSVLGIWRKA